VVLAGLIAALVLAGMLHAREADAVEDNTELAKKTQNPVADLISVPFQSVPSGPGTPRTGSSASRSSSCSRPSGSA
jgi:hypothetical protein